MSYDKATDMLVCDATIGPWPRNMICGAPPEVELAFQDGDVIAQYCIRHLRSDAEYAWESQVLCMNDVVLRRIRRKDGAA